MKKAVCLCLVVLLAVGAWLGVMHWRDHVARWHDAQLCRTAGELLKTGRTVEAAAVIHSRLPGVEVTPEATRRWRGLQVAVAARLHQVAQLLAIDERWPEAIARDEEGSLTVARARLNASHPAETQRLVDMWLPKSTQPQTWFVLEADTLLADKKRDEALALLKSRAFGGPADCARLARLALLSSDDLKTAWNYLAQAYNLDPRNAEIRSFRAQVLERIGKVPLARVEYIAAQQADPDNLLLRDQLAEFYRRQDSMADALAVWTGDPAHPVFDFMWVKAWFWSHVAHPARLMPTREDELAPLVRFLRALPDDRFWDAEGFARIAGEKHFVRQRQETFWLSLLENLRAHDDKAAAERLRLNRFNTESWQPDLEAALQRILSYRMTGVLNPRNEPLPALCRPKEELHSFFVQLDDLALAEREKRLAMPPETDALLRGDEAFAAAFLAAGWSEAALRLRPADERGGALPSWLAYGFTQALRLNRDNAAAIAFAEKQRPSPELTLVLGEAQLARTRRTRPRPACAARHGGFRRGLPRRVAARPCVVGPPPARRRRADRGRPAPAGVEHGRARTAGPRCHRRGPPPRRRPGLRGHRRRLPRGQDLPRPTRLRSQGLEGRPPLHGRTARLVPRPAHPPRQPGSHRQGGARRIMKPRDLLWPAGLAALAAWIWLRDLGRWTEAADTLPVLAALPMFVWLAAPWKFTPITGKLSPVSSGASLVLLLAGSLGDLTLLLSAGWTTLLWTWLGPRLDPATRPAVRRLLVLPVLAFPWIAYEGQALGWWFRLSAAATAQAVFCGLGLQVARAGTDLVVQGCPVAVAPACAGLGTLQAMLIAGCVPAYLYFGERGGVKYWVALVSLLGVSWAANTIRVMSVVVAAVTRGPEFAMGAFHQFGGLLVIFATFCLCCGVFSFLQRLRTAPTRSPV